VEPSVQPKVEVVITPEGVEVVRLYGASWADEDAAVALFRRLSPFLRQVSLFLAGDAVHESKPS
jgi:hypothetical protein